MTTQNATNPATPPETTLVAALGELVAGWLGGEEGVGVELMAWSSAATAEALRPNRLVRTQVGSAYDEPGVTGLSMSRLMRPRLLKPQIVL